MNKLKLVMLIALIGLLSTSLVSAELNVLLESNNTTSAFDKNYPQLQVVGDTIYYTWSEHDGVLLNQIRTAQSGLNGIITETNITTSAFDKNYPQLQVVGDTIYYTWREGVGGYTQIRTAQSGLNGIITETNITTSAFYKYDPQLQVVGDTNTIYYTWGEVVSGYYQIRTAQSSLDGSNFTETNITTSAFNKFNPQFQVVGDTIYYTWSEHVVTNNQIHNAQSGLNGIITETNITTSEAEKNYPQLQVVGDTIYYTWREDVSGYDQTRTAQSSLDGSNFTETNITTSELRKDYPQLQVVGDTIYYTWREGVGGYSQIAIGYMDLPTGETYVPPLNRQGWLNIIFQLCHDRIYAMSQSSFLLMPIGLLMIGFSLVLGGFMGKNPIFIVFGIITVIIAFSMILLGNYIVTAIASILKYDL